MQTWGGGAYQVEAGSAGLSVKPWGHRWRPRQRPPVLFPSRRQPERAGGWTSMAPTKRRWRYHWPPPVALKQTGRDWLPVRTGQLQLRAGGPPAGSQPERVGALQAGPAQAGPAQAGPVPAGMLPGGSPQAEVRPDAQSGVGRAVEVPPGAARIRLRDRAGLAPGRHGQPARQPRMAPALAGPPSPRWWQRWIDWKRHGWSGWPPGYRPHRGSPPSQALPSRAPWSGYLLTRKARAAPGGANPPGPPCDGRDRPAAPRCSRSGF
jgi:hypothetical protein